MRPEHGERKRRNLLLNHEHNSQHTVSVNTGTGSIRVLTSSTTQDSTWTIALTYAYLFLFLFSFLIYKNESRAVKYGIGRNDVCPVMSHGETRVENSKIRIETRCPLSTLNDVYPKVL